MLYNKFKCINLSKILKSKAIKFNIVDLTDYFLHIDFCLIFLFFLILKN